MHYRLCVSVLAIAACAVLGSRTAAQTAVSPIQPQVDKLFSRWTASTPGCAVGADVKGQPVARGAYGMADLEHDVPVTLETIFEVGSVSKQFTAAAVLLLERDGKLSLDDKVRKYIPEMPDVAADITIRQMLNHTAGLRDWGSLAAIEGWPRTSRVHTHAHVLDFVSRQRMLNFEPGTRWSYSNTGYNLAAILVARVSGMSFADFTRARIFEPLGMKDTSWRDDHTRIVKRRAIAYSGQKEFSTLMPFENVHGNGGLLTTVGDLLKWNANFTKPVVGDAKFIADMERRTRFTDGREHEYALGLYVDTYRGRREVDHSGGTAGYVAHLSRYPDHGVSVAVMCNVTSGGATNAAKAIADLLLPAIGGLPGSDLSRLLDTGEGPRFAGLYRSLQPAGVISITDQQGTLVSTNAGRLRRRADRRFDGDGDRVFDFDGRGGLRVTDEFGTSDTYQRVEPWKPGRAELQAVAGRYTSDELQLTVEITLDGDRLIIRRPDVTLVLLPVFPDGFQSGAGWVVVRRDDSGRVTGFSVNQDRVWDLRFTRQPD